MSLQETIRDELQVDIGFQRISGGDTHRCFCVYDLENPQKRYFLKSNEAQFYHVLESEFRSLQRLHALIPNVYPRPIKIIRSHNQIALLLDWHDLSALNESNANAVGAVLAKQHNVSHSRFGWDEDNYIGLTPQINHWSDNWADFFVERRLKPQLQQAKNNNLTDAVARRVASTIERAYEVLERRSVTPCLLHGDLWVGNLAYDADRRSGLLFDPAPYYGDPLVDIAMTQLFGVLPGNFYSVFSIPSNFDELSRMYNLYHALNHYNLFGNTYTTLVSSHIV